MSKPKYVLARDVRIEKVNTLYGGRLVRGKLTMYQGEGGCGKGLALIHACTVLSKAGHQIVWASGEDSGPDTIIPRFKASRANLDNIVVPPIGSLQSLHPDHLKPFMADMRELLPNLSVLILDSLKDFMLGVDTNRDGPTRLVLTDLAGYLEDYDIAGVGINHLNKNEEHNAKNRGLGTVSINDHARLLWTFAYDPVMDCTYMAFTKGNLGIKPAGAIYHLQRREIQKYDRLTKEWVSDDQEYVEMSGEPYREHADSLLARLNRQRRQLGDDPSTTPKLDAAETFIGELIPFGGEMDSTVAIARCHQAGHKDGVMEDARGLCGIVDGTKRGTDGRFLHHVWRRPHRGESLKESETLSGRKAPLGHIVFSDSTKDGHPGDGTPNGQADGADTLDAYHNFNQLIMSAKAERRSS